MVDAASVVRAGWEAENRAAAQRLVGAHQVMLACLAHPDCSLDPDRPGYTVVDPEVMAVGHLVQSMAVSSYKAEAMLCLATDVHLRYPAILEAMTQGRMDQTAAVILAGQMGYVDPSVLEQVQREVVDDYLARIESGQRPGAKAIRDRADQLIAKHDPDAVRNRKADGVRERGARISKGRDGMSTLHALLQADEAAVLAEALDEKVAADTENERATRATASTAGGEDDPTDSTAAGLGAGVGHDDSASSSASGSDPVEGYSLAQRRADALLSLVCGDATGLTGSDGSRGGVMLRPKVTVIAPTGAPTPGTPNAGGAPAAGGFPGSVGGWSDRVRVEFTRTGEAAIGALWQMLTAADGATLQHIDPALGAADNPADALRYRPSTALAQRVRLRDGTCRHPGCAVPAQACDLDHAVPFNHADPAKGGLTIEANLMCLCRKHHRFKTFNDWRYRLDPDGTLTLTTPEGPTMVTHGSGPLAAYRRERADATADTAADAHTSADTRAQGRTPSQADDRTQPQAQSRSLSPAEAQAEAMAAAQAEAEAWERQQNRNPDPGPNRDRDRADDAGEAEARGHAEESSWARRETRRRARGERQRLHNADERRRRARARAGVFNALALSTDPQVIDLSARRQASRWWDTNRLRYQHLGRDRRPSLLEHQLLQALSERGSDEGPDDPPPF